MDPAFAKSQNNIWAVDHIFNQLVDLNDDLEITPELAHSWEITEDGLHYIFHIRTDVWFHKDPCFGADSSRRLSAEDVKFSLLRLINPELSAPGSWVFQDKLDDHNPIEVNYDSTLVFHLKSPFSPFLSLLTMQYCSILPREATEYYGLDIRSHPVGTGPFYLHKWLDRQGIFLKKNQFYFKSGLPLLKGVRISFVEDRNTAFLVFMRKGIDFFSGLQSSFGAQLIDDHGNLQSKLQDKMQMIKAEYLNTEYIGINLEALPESHALQDKKFRRALNIGINREEMIRIFRHGLASPAEFGFIPSVLKDSIYKVRRISYLPDSAKKIIQDIGYQSFSNEDKLITLYTNKDYLDLISYIARQWQELGILVQIELMETATLREKMRAGTVGMFRASWIADYPDQESFATIFYSKNPAPPNYTRFKNAAYDSLYEKAIQETEASERNYLYFKMETILCEESPVVFILYDQIALFAQKNITGLKGNAINLLKLEQVQDLE
ncbi:MAG: ABC transporter substrate-binding protein [Saprospiraceae bacterium]|nr:ABC transporter substrate-binding protein [Saprospiraceae bacterium]